MPTNNAIERENVLVEIGYVLLGLFVLLTPGFMLTLIFFPKPGSLDFWKRMGLSLGLGVVALFYIGVALSHPEWRMLRFGPFIAAVLIFCIFCAAVAYIRRGLAIPIAYARAVIRVFYKPKPPPPPPPPAPPVQPIQEQPRPLEEKPKPPEEKPQPAPERPPEQPPEREQEGGEGV